MNDSGKEPKVPLHDKCASVMLNSPISQTPYYVALLLHKGMHQAAALSLQSKTFTVSVSMGEVQSTEVYMV